MITLQDMNIIRCIKPKHFCEVIHCSLLDACETDYGMSAYIRLVNAEGVIHCFLRLGKSWATPLKFITIPPWLEPTAATLSVNVSRIIREKIAVHMNDEIFWTNSQVALVYITISKCFRTCKVSKSLRLIKSNNPADNNSRGLESQHQEKIKRWFEGPSFLWSKEQLWLKNAASSDTRWGSWD